MNNTLLTALIAGSFALLGGIISSIFTLMATKMANDHEDYRKKFDTYNDATKVRLRELYKPLRQIFLKVSRTDFYIDDTLFQDIATIFEQNSIYSSPELEELYEEFKFLFTTQPTQNDIIIRFSNQLQDEYYELKSSLGFGKVMAGKKASKKSLVQ